MSITGVVLLLLLLAAATTVYWWVWNQHQQESEDDAPLAKDERISPLLRGINYLLADQPDLALQEMVQVARLRSDAIDVYMALGEMFRASGEIGRAVRIHQNLLARPDLPNDSRLQAFYALGRDFHTGGLLDRALRQYEHALAIQSDHLPSLEASLRIREQSQEWLLAEELLCRIERIRGEASHFYRASLYAEEARRCWRDDQDLPQARAYAQKAVGLDGSCAAAYLMQLELLVADASPWSEMEALFRTLWQQCRHHAAQAIPVWVGDPSYRQASESLLLACWREDHDEQMILLWLEQLHGLGLTSDIARLLSQGWFSPLSLRGELRLLALQPDSEGAQQKLITHARNWRKQVKDYCCHSCGVEVREMRWQCPQCHQWGTMRALEGEVL